MSVGRPEEPDHSPDDLPPRPFDDEVWQKLNLFRSHARTRRAVLAGEELHRLTPAERSERGLLGPWQFDLAGSIFALLTAGVLFSVLEVLIGPAPPSEAATALSPKIQEINSLAERISTHLCKGVPPVILTLNAHFLARASLKRTDATPQRVTIARRAYLYLDGAHNFIPQILTVFGISALMFGFGREATWAAVMRWLGGGVLTVGFVWQWFEVAHRVPRRLFTINGYSPCPPRLLKNYDPSCGPWRRYLAALMLALPALGLFFVFLLVAFAFGVAWLIVSVRGA